MQVEFIRPWRNYRRGQVIDPPPGPAREMIRRGIVVAVETAPATGTVTMTPPVSVVGAFADQASKTSKKRKG